MNCPAGYIPLKKACWKISSAAATQANAETACQADRTGQFTSGNFFKEFAPSEFSNFEPSEFSRSQLTINFSIVGFDNRYS